MARGKPWTDNENSMLLEMANQGMSPQEIYDSGKLPGRTFQAIVKQLNTFSSLVKTNRTAIVKTIEPAADALSMDEVVKLFSTAFKQICELEEVDKLTLERFRIIFQAAKDYAPLLSRYEEWEALKQRVEKIEKLLAEIKSQRAEQKS
jgi:cell fate (sporulation/competence/biofilm development) regulator YmcA (YheA/YmcA/DUF963 family)